MQPELIKIWFILVIALQDLLDLDHYEEFDDSEEGQTDALPMDTE